MTLEALPYFWQQLSFLSPWMLAFLPLPWLIRRIFQPAPQQQVPLLAPHLIRRFESSGASLMQPAVKQITSLPVL